MASGNKWLGKIRSGAKSVQEAAKTRLEKVSETIDKKIKEAQEDLDRYFFPVNFESHCVLIFVKTTCSRSARTSSTKNTEMAAISR